MVFALAPVVALAVPLVALVPLVRVKRKVPEVQADVAEVMLWALNKIWMLPSTEFVPLMSIGLMFATSFIYWVGINPERDREALEAKHAHTGPTLFRRRHGRWPRPTGS